MSFRGFVLIATALSLISSTALASDSWISGVGERLFGPDLSENQACQDAEHRARLDALRQITGETVTSEDLVLCQERSDSQSCELNQRTWSQTEGLITGIRGMSRMVTRNGGLRKCVVELEAQIQQSPGQYDPNFNLTVRLNQRIFRNGEELTLQIAPTQPMYITIFQWLPYVSGDLAVQKVFPNNFDDNNYFERLTAIPRRGGYGFTLSFPTKKIRDSRMADEFLIAVASKEKLLFSDRYSLEDLRRELVRLPKETHRLFRTSYSISR